MKIILLGYMASGKSTVGKVLSKKLNISFIDLDNYISEKEKMSITKIFKTKGEIYFREIENKYVKEILEKEEKFILSLGGGTPCYGNTMKLINNTNNATSIYIKASINELATRLINEKSKRPLVANLEKEEITEFVAKHLFERSFFYEQAKIIVSTKNKSVKDIVTEIRVLLY